MATIGTVDDHFDGAVVDSAVWNDVVGVTLSNGKASIASGGNLLSVAFDATAGGVIFQVDTFGDRWSLFLGDAWGSAGFDVDPSVPGQIRLRRDGTTTWIAFDATQKYLGFIIDAGQLTHIASTDGATWTTLLTGALTYAKTAARIQIYESNTTLVLERVKGFDGATPPSMVDLDPPGEVQNLTAVAGDAAITVDWDAPLNDGGAAITDYEIEYTAGSAGGGAGGIVSGPSVSSFIPITYVAGEAVWTTFNDGVSTTTDATITGLTNDTQYRVRVRAVNSEGAGPWTEVGPVTPVAPPQPLAGEIIGEAVAITSGNTLNAPVQQATPAGTLLIVTVGTDNLGFAGPLHTVTDSVGNTYSHVGRRSAPSTNQTGVNIEVFIASLTTPLTLSDTITVTADSSVPARTVRVQGFDGYLPITRDGFVHAASSSTTWASTTRAVTMPQTGDLVFGVGMMEYNVPPPNFTLDTDITNGVWENVPWLVADTGTDLTSMQQFAQYKFVNASGTQEWTPTWDTTTVDYGVGLLVFVPTGTTFPISYIGRGTISSTITEGATISPGIPAGTAEGDVMLMTVSGFPATAGTVAGTEGWTEVATGSHIFYKTAGASETSPVLTPDSNYTTAGVASFIDTFRGVNPANITQHYTHSTSLSGLEYYGNTGTNQTPPEANTLAVWYVRRNVANATFRMSDFRGFQLQNQYNGEGNHAGMIAISQRNPALGFRLPYTHSLPSAGSVAWRADLLWLRPAV